MSSVQSQLIASVNSIKASAELIRQFSHEDADFVVENGLPGGLPTLARFLELVRQEVLDLVGGFQGGRFHAQSFAPGGVGPFTFEHTRAGGVLLVVLDGAVQSPSFYAATTTTLTMNFDTSGYQTFDVYFTY